MKYLYHITFWDNLDNISKLGLIPRYNNSNYGNPPIHKAIYLYKSHTVFKEFFNMFHPFHKLAVLRINVSDLDNSQLLADEDYYRYPKKRKIPPKGEMRIQAVQCLNDFGTVAYTCKIPSNCITIQQVYEKESN